VTGGCMQAEVAQSILVGVDGSEASNRALTTAAHLARLAGARLLIAHVEAPAAYPSELHGMVTERKQFPAAAQRALALARQQVAGIETEGNCCEGFVAESLEEKAAERKADLLVVGKHGRSAVHRLLMGSVADRQAHIAQRPLLIVP